MNADSRSPQAMRPTAADEPLRGLSEGLRAGSLESRDPAIRSLLARLAERVAAGMELEEAFADLKPKPPPHLRGLFLVAQRTGRLPDLLGTLVAARQRQRSLNTFLLLRMAYPVSVLAACVAVTLLATAFCVLPVRAVFDSFGLAMPDWMMAMFWVQDQGVWWLAGVLAMILLAAGILKLLLSRRYWHSLLHSLPLLGSMWKWAGAAEFARLLAMLSSYQVPLDEALELTAEGLYDRRIAWASRKLADAARQGQSLASAMAGQSAIPPWMIPLTAWGEKHAALPEALEQAGDDLENAARARAELLGRLGPGFTLLITAVLVLFTAISLFAPLVQMLSSLV